MKENHIYGHFSHLYFACPVGWNARLQRSCGHIELTRHDDREHAECTPCNELFGRRGPVFDDFKHTCNAFRVCRGGAAPGRVLRGVVPPRRLGVQVVVFEGTDLTDRPLALEGWTRLPY